MGTLIFVGILFTSIIPMYLVMKQVDNIYTQNVHEMSISDQDRAKESVEAYAYPINDQSNKITVKVTNTGIIPVKIVRVWINNVNYTVASNLASQDSAVLGNFTVTLVNGKNYDSSVTTNRGNSFASTSPSPFYINDYWFTPSLGIHVIVLNQANAKYKIRVNSTGGWTSPNPYETQGTDKQNIEWTELVSTQGNYLVEVKKWVGGIWVNLPGTPIPVTIAWPGVSPVINVVVDGRGI
jgi:archaellum component FlaF (FlaF/FlaG flagellin family)